MSDKEERKISLEKRRQMLKNLEKARATRAKNLAEKKENVVIDEGKKEPVEEIDEETADSKVAPPEVKHECLCGRKYKRKDGLFRHQQKCAVWIEERAEDAEQEEEIAEIKAEREAEEKENVKPKKKRAKKVNIVVEEKVEVEEEVEEEVKPKPIPPPAPPKKKNIVPSAEPRYHNGQEPLEKFTMEEWRQKHEADKLARYEAASRKKFEEQEDRIRRLKAGMMSGGI